MKSYGPRLVVAALVLVLFWGVGALYRLRVARGDVFPAYSSLRADPLGTRALHDAAVLLPGRTVVRWLEPLERFHANQNDLVIMSGVRRHRDLDTDEWAAVDRAVIKGARVVVAWHAEHALDGDATEARLVRADSWMRRDAPDPKESGEGKEAESDASEEPAAQKTEKPKLKQAGPEANPRYATEQEWQWGVRFLRRELLVMADRPDAVRTAAAPASWPESLARWQSDLFFLPRPADGWRVLYRRGGEVVMMERTRGAGTILLLADSFILSNEAVSRERSTAVLASIFGDSSRIIFVESHLGIAVETGVAVLARRYGLGAAALTALLLAALWIWRRASPLAPILPEEAEVRLTLAPTAGLEALLRRAVSPARLFSTCVDAWRKTASATDLQRVDATQETTEPVAAYNRTSRALSKKHLS